MQDTAADTWCFEYTVAARDGGSVDRGRSEAITTAITEWVAARELSIEGGGALPFGSDTLEKWDVMIWLQAADRKSPVSRAQAGEMWAHIVERAHADGLKVDGEFTPPPFRTPGREPRGRSRRSR